MDVDFGYRRAPDRHRLSFLRCQERAISVSVPFHELCNSWNVAVSQLVRQIGFILDEEIVETPKVGIVLRPAYRYHKA